MSIWSDVCIAMFFVVFAIGCYTVLKWMRDILIAECLRWSLRRHNGIPYLVLEDWADEVDFQDRK